MIMAEEKKVDVIDLLLRPDAPDVKKHLPTAEYEVKRLSKSFGAPFSVVLTALTYNSIQELRLVSDSSIQIVLEGVKSPNLRDSRLLERYGCATPAELVKAIFLPGEIDELSRAVEKLCGYRQSMLEEIKKN